VAARKAKRDLIAKNMVILIMIIDIHDIGSTLISDIVLPATALTTRQKINHVDTLQRRRRKTTYIILYIIKNIYKINILIV
jgi:hypothetical protein